MPRAINIARGPEREPDNSVTRNVCSARGIEKCRSAIESMLHDAELGCRSPTTGQVAEIFLDYPPKLTCLCDGALPGSRSEILSADRRILCNDIWMTLWLKIDCHEVGPGLGDNDVVAIHDDSEVYLMHGPEV